MKEVIMKRLIAACLLAGIGLYISGCSNEPPKPAPTNQPAAGDQPKDHEPPAKTEQK
jgi:hypothetical protein